MLSGGDDLVDQMWAVSKRCSGLPDVCCQVEMVWVTKYGLSVKNVLVDQIWAVSKNIFWSTRCGLSVKDVLVDEMCVVRCRWSGGPNVGCQ